MKYIKNTAKTLYIDNLIQQWKTILRETRRVAQVVLPWSRGKIEKSFSPKLTDYFIQGVSKPNVHKQDSQNCQTLLKPEGDES